MAGKRHEKRFIVLKKEEGVDSVYIRSYTITEHFPTKEEAQAAIDGRGSKNPAISYKIRQK